MALRSFVNKLYSKKYLLLTNTATGTLFFVAGDAFDQKVLNRQAIDGRRIESMAIVGTIFGFAGHYWYKFLDRRFTSVPKKLLCDAAMGPPFGSMLFIMTGWLEKKPLSQTVNDIRANLLTLLMADWFFYIPLQVVNFRYVNPRFRFLYVCGISLVYDTFLAHILHKGSDETQSVPKSDE